jgi:hypothetical protein
VCDGAAAAAGERGITGRMVGGGEGSLESSSRVGDGSSTGEVGSVAGRRIGDRSWTNPAGRVASGSGQRVVVFVVTREVRVRELEGGKARFRLLTTSKGSRSAGVLACLDDGSRVIEWRKCRPAPRS